MQKFLDLVTKICQPNPKTIQDQTELSSRLKKNKVLFWCIFTMTILQPFTIFTSTLPLKSDLLITLTNIACLVAFVTLCISYIWLFDLIWTAIVAFCLVVIISLDDKISLSLWYNVCTFLWLHNISHQQLFSDCYLRYYPSHHTYLRVIGSLMMSMNFEEFLDKQAQANNMVIIFMTIILAVTFNTLDKKTKEVAKAKKETEEALEHQKTFVFSFSHELRNPLNSLQGNLQLALMSSLPNETREVIKTAKVCGELLLQLINNVLDTGKSDLGKLVVSPSPTKIHDLFQRVWAVSTELISRKILKDHLKIEKKIPPILLLDGHRVNQVLMNLIGNAIKFTEKGAISISIK